MRRERGPLAAALASVGSFLVEPVEPPAGVASTPPPAAVARPVVTVFGLAPGCGSTVVARAVATALGARDPAGAATVTSEGRAALPPLGTGAATRLARLVAEFPGADARATGRLCVVRGVDPLALADGARHLAPVVLDAGSSLGGVHAALPDHLLLVTTPRLEPALARVAAECLARVGPEPRIVVNRVAGLAGLAGLAGTASMGPGAGLADVAGSLADAVFLPEARLAAQLALRGREPPGELGRVIASLAAELAM